MLVGWHVNLTEHVQGFIRELDEDDRARVLGAVKFLAEQGPGLGRPRVDVIKSSRHKNMKELRVSSGNKEFRLFFAFDIDRQVILLVGGEKLSYGVKKFYEDFVPVADQLFDDHLAAAKARREGMEPISSPLKRKKTRRRT